MMLKVPFFNNHTSSGPFKTKIIPSHYSWISHILLGALAVQYTWIIPIFILYQIIQIYQKNLIHDELVDIIEFILSYIFFKIVR